MNYKNSIKIIKDELNNIKNIKYRINDISGDFITTVDFVGSVLPLVNNP